MSTFRLIAVILAGIAVADAGDPPPARDLGVPITAQNRISYKTAYQFGPGKQNLLCWTTTAESGGYFCALDLASGDLAIHPLNHLEAYPIVYGSDGRVYTGSTSGEVFSWDPRMDAWTALGRPLFAHPGAVVNHVRVLCEGEGGWLYAGSCHGERARVHMRTGTIEKLPPMREEGQWYVSAIAALPDGRIAFGYGYQARVVIYDPLLGQDVGQWLPEEWTRDGFCFNILAGSSVLYATHFPSGRRAAIDARTGAFLGEIPWPRDSLQHPWSRWSRSSGHGSAVDFTVLPGTDTAAASDGEVVHMFNPRSSPPAWTVPLSDLRVPPELALELRHEVTSDCRVLVYDAMRRGVQEERRPQLPPVERMLFSLGGGPDGKIYGGAYQSTLLFSHDPPTGQTMVLGDHHPGWSGETFSYAVSRGELLCASYTNGALVAYDPRRPWQCERGSMVNPRLLGFFGQHLYRPYATCVTEDGNVWSVGPAGWGSSGGGIGVYHATAGTLMTTPLPDVPQTIVPLRHQGLLICGDSFLQWWDPKVNAAYGSLRIPFRCVDACLWGADSSMVLMLADGGRLICVDAGSREGYRVITTVQLPFSCSRVLAVGNRAVAGGEGGLVCVDMVSGRADHFCSTPLGSRWAFTALGNSVYFARGARLLSASLPDSSLPAR